MKRAFVVACVLVPLIAAAVAWHGRNTPDFSHDIAPGAPAAKLLGVDELMKHVGEYKGPLKVEGVVCSADSGKKMLLLIDRREFQECGTNGCAEYTLPVRWEGAMPAAKDTVQVRGEVMDSGGKLVFAASQVEIAPEGESK